MNVKALQILNIFGFILASLNDISLGANYDGDPFFVD